MATKTPKSKNAVCAFDCIDNELNVCALCGRAFIGTDGQTVCDNCIAEVLYADMDTYAFSDDGPTEYVCA